MSSITKSTEMKIDYSLIPENVPALCVPYVFENINETRIRGIFKDLDIGEVNQVDLVPYTASDGKRVNRVFIHLKWNTQESTNKVRTKLLCGREIKVVYEDPWFWCVSASRANKAPPREKKAPTKSRPRIEDDDDEEENVKPKPPRKSKSEREPRDAYRKSQVKQPPIAPCLPSPPPTQEQEHEDNIYYEHKHVAPRMPKQRVNLKPQPQHVHDEVKEDEDDVSTITTSTNTSVTRRSNYLDVDDMRVQPFEYTNMVNANDLPVKKKKTTTATKKRILEEDNKDEEKTTKSDD